MIGLIGKKVGMSQVFNENGEVIPVSVVRVGPCPVVQKKSEGKEGYNAIQVAFETVRPTKANLPSLGHFKKADLPPYRFLGEFKVDNPDEYEVGQLLSVEVFHGIERVDVTGNSKGKGFQGVMKRHGFHGGKGSHGVIGHRKPGSIGCSADPSRVAKGKKMPGRMGNRKTHVKNLKVVEIDAENNLLLVEGAVPGARNTVLRITAQPSK